MDKDKKQDKQFSVAKDGGLDAHRAKNPGHKPLDPGQGRKTDGDQPWISNYPPLDGWLRANDARCDWQMRYGKGKDGFMLEQWRMPGSMPFVVLVYTRGAGWEIFTPGASNSVRLTLSDAKQRIYASENVLHPGKSALVQCPTCEGKCLLDPNVDCETCGNDGKVRR